MITSRVDHHRKHYHAIRGLCSVDPLTLAAGGLGALAGGLFGGGASTQAAATPTPTPPPAAPPPQQQPIGQAKKPAQQSSFVGGVPTVPQSTGQKTLLGQ